MCAQRAERDSKGALGLCVALPVLWLGITSAIQLRQDTYSLFYRFGLAPRSIFYPFILDWTLPLRLSPLITMLFVHSSLYHTLLNGFLFALCGRELERDTGFWFGLIFLAIGVLGGSIHLTLNPLLDKVALGAGGVVGFCVGYAIVPIRSRLTVLTALGWLALQIAGGLPGTLGERYFRSSAFIFCGGLDWRAVFACVLGGATLRVALKRKKPGSSVTGRRASAPLFPQHPSPPF